MTTRVKNAIKVFIFIAVAVTVALSIDYTDTYVADRFHRSLETGQFPTGVPTSLDRFIEYYDWDTVCIITPSTDVPELKTQLGRPYKLRASGSDMWSLVFIKSGFVEVEIPLSREQVDFPLGLVEPCLERWAAIVTIKESGGVRSMEFSGQ